MHSVTGNANQVVLGSANFELNEEELEAQYQRRIIHIDMDAFFASVEQRDHPELKGKPVIVGGKPDSRGVVAACSYEARQFGVHSAMPCSQANRLCPNAVYVRPNIAKYREVSKEIHKVFSEFTDLIEPLSLDEAYLDVTDSHIPATELARTIKEKIKQRVDLVASAGVSYNKFLAKLASDMDKPDGLFVIRPKHTRQLIDSLSIRKFHGIGPATEKKFARLGVTTGEQLRQLPLALLLENFKSSARYYYQIARGIDTRSVKSSRKRVSIGSERTFSKDLIEQTEIENFLIDLAIDLGVSLNKKQLCAFTLTLKFKFTNFKQITRSMTLQHPVDFTGRDGLGSLIKHLVHKADLQGRAVRLLGVSCSKLVSLDSSNLEPDASQPYQMGLLE